MREPTEREMQAVARLRRVETDLRISDRLGYAERRVLDEAVQRLRVGLERPVQAAELTTSEILREVVEELADAAAYLALLPASVDSLCVRDAIQDVLLCAWAVEMHVRDGEEEERDG